MIIRKLFKFEGAHVVRDCACSTRCSQSIHGHSMIVEIFLTSDGLDRGGMIMDFGLLKGTIGEFIDSFDHAYSMWTQESTEFKDTIKKLSSRWVELPCSPSAENYSLLFLFVIDKILKNTEFKNNEKNVRVSSVRIHETATGYAEAFIEDLNWVKYKLPEIRFSEAIVDEWKNKEWFEQLMTNTHYINPIPEYQIFKHANKIADIKELMDNMVTDAVSDDVLCRNIESLDTETVSGLMKMSDTLKSGLMTLLMKEVTGGINSYTDAIDILPGIMQILPEKEYLEFKSILSFAKSIGDKNE